MLKITNESYENAYRKLLQAKSLTIILLDNINYKNEGLEEPIIDTFNAGNLAWTAADLIEEALKELDVCSPEEDKENA